MKKLYDLLPKALYFLGCSREAKTLDIYIRTDAIVGLTDMLNREGFKKNLVAAKAEKLSGIYTTYNPNFLDRHGFGNCGIISGEFGIFTKISFVLMSQKNNSPEKCTECKGKGKSMGRDCFYCEGTGKKVLQNQEGILHNFAVTNTLNLLLWTLDAYSNIWEDKDLEDVYFDQLYILHSCSDHGAYGHAVDGATSPFFQNMMLSYFAKAQQKQNNEYVQPKVVQETMHEIYVHLTLSKKDAYSSGSIYAVLSKNAHFHIATVGQNDCCIASESSGMCSSWIGEAPNKGIAITCHNLDGAVQQLVILSGLAALSEEIIISENKTQE